MSKTRSHDGVSAKPVSDGIGLREIEGVRQTERQQTALCLVVIIHVLDRRIQNLFAHVFAGHALPEVAVIPRERSTDFLRVSINMSQTCYSVEIDVAILKCPVAIEERAGNIVGYCPIGLGKTCVCVVIPVEIDLLASKPRQCP